MIINIIIADDHQLFIDGIKSILNKSIDIKTIGEAKNGLEVIKLLENGMKPDVILTDIRMPIMDGISLTKIVSQDYPDIKVLALSMYDQTADVIDMLNAGAKGYVTKNVEKKELIKALNTIIKDKFFFSENLPKDIYDWFKAGQVSTKKNTLTKREIEILNLVAKGRTSIQIAKELSLSKFTVDTHRKNIHKKLGIKTNTGLVNYTLKNLK